MSEILIGWNHSLLHNLRNNHCLGHVILNLANVITFGQCNGSNVITFECNYICPFGLSGSQFCKCNYICPNVITFAQMLLHLTLVGSPPGVFIKPCDDVGQCRAAAAADRKKRLAIEEQRLKVEQKRLKLKEGRAKTCENILKVCQCNSSLSVERLICCCNRLCVKYV